MPIDSKLYPPEWRAMRAEKLKAVGFRCEECGIVDRAIQESSQGNPYMVHLSIAHCRQYETWKKDAETMVLCQRCHRRYDRQFRRKSGTRYHTPIGYASVYVEYHGRSVLAEMARTFDELRDVVAALPVGSEIEIHLVVILAVVGNGHYRKGVDGSLVVIAEYGCCIGLAPQL